MKCNKCGEEAELHDAEELGMICMDCSEPMIVNCSNRRCGKKTVCDSIYEDLCSSCCRAENE